MSVLTRRIVTEKVGVVLGIDELADSVTGTFLSTVTHLINNNEFNIENTIRIPINVPNNLLDDTFIGRVTVRANFTRIGEGVNIGGNFTPSSIEKYTIGNAFFHDIIINLNLEWDFNTDIQKNLSSFFAHELHHAYDKIKRFGIRSKSNAFNGVKNLIRGVIPEIINNNPVLDYFLECFYLSIPEEVNARVHEVYNVIKSHRNDNYEDLMVIVNETRTMKDAEKMRFYNANQIMNIPINILEEFVFQFNETLEMSLLSLGFRKNDIKYFKEPRYFFRYWQDKINDSGENLRFKTLKVAGSLKELNIRESIKLRKEIQIECRRVFVPVQVIIEQNHMINDI